MKPTLKAGLAGTGFAARFHYDALIRVYGVQVQVAGVWSPTAKNRKAFATERGIREFATLDALVDSCDVIHACVPPANHEEVALKVLGAGKSVIMEKPLTGYFGDGSQSFNGDRFDRRVGREKALASVRRILDAEAASEGKILYAENWVYAPSLQKEREIIEKTDARILRILAEESHSGSHSPYYGKWEYSGGGSLMCKSVHPLSGALYLKAAEGRNRDGNPIRPVSVSARTHAVTRSPGFVDRGFLRSSYTDVEDYGVLHVLFSDGSIADIIASELVLGGIKNRMEVFADNHRADIAINPNTALSTFNPSGPQFSNIYVVEKIETKEGWAPTSPDEDWFTGYLHEMEAFYRSAAYNEPVESDSLLAADTIATVYSAYLSAEGRGVETAIPQDY